MKVESNVTTIAGAVLSGLASASCRSAWFGARTLLSEFPPLVTLQTVETTRQRTLCVGARLEQQAVAGAGSKSVEAAKTIALSIDGGHVRAAREYQGRSFEALLAQVGSDEGKQVVFSSVPAEAHSQTRQLRGMLHGSRTRRSTPAFGIRLFAQYKIGVGGWRSSRS